MRAKVLFLTERGLVHQREALRAAPDLLDVTMLRDPSERELFDALARADILVSERNVPVTRAMIEAAPRLKLIVRLGSLCHDIDIPAARSRGVAVSRQPVRSSINAAEHVLLMTLAILRRLPRAMRAMTGPAPVGRAPRRTT